jgi:chromosomal replication initiation ATPase DnaA
VTGGPRQLALEWPHAESYAREDFLAAPENMEALRRIEAWPNWPSPILMLIGPAGSGKSHLGAIWARAAGALSVNGAALASADPVALTGGPALLIDDADAVTGGETELFHILNLLRENAIGALLTASRPPDAWGLRTPDLLSRLRLAPIAELHAPDLDLVRAVLMKLFSDRQLAVEPAAVNFVALRIERSFEAARAAVAALDREAMARGRSITRTFAAEILRDPGVAGERHEGDTFPG